MLQVYLGECQRPDHCTLASFIAIIVIVVVSQDGMVPLNGCESGKACESCANNGTNYFSAIYVDLRRLLPPC